MAYSNMFDYLDDENTVKRVTPLNEEDDDEAGNQETQSSPSYGDLKRNIGDRFRVNPPRSVVQAITGKKRKRTMEDNIDDERENVRNIINERAKRRGEFSEKIEAPVDKGKWYTRALASGLFGLANRQPGETIAESLGRGIGTGIGLAVMPKGYQNMVKQIRNNDLAKNYSAQKAISDESLNDQMMLHKMDKEDQATKIAQQREDRMLQHGLDTFEQGNEKLRQGAEKLEDTRKKVEGEQELRKRGLDIREHHYDTQDKLKAQGVSIDVKQEAELERHNRAMEATKGGKNGENLEEYEILAVDPQGRSKAVKIKVPKGEDPLDYVKQIQTQAAPKKGQFPTETPRPSNQGPNPNGLSPQGAQGSPALPKTGSTDIQKRNQSAIDQLRAGGSKNLNRLTQ